jgi:putative DNA primase/helicase
MTTPRSAFVPLRERTRGRWREILVGVGIDHKHLAKAVPCPLCGGTDRFRFYDTDGNGTWFCRGCGHGSGADLVMRFRGVEFRDAAELIEQYIGPAPIGAKSAKSSVDPQIRLRKLWSAATPTVQGDIVDRYLRSRCVGLDEYPTCIRTARKLRYYDDDATSTFPTMLAMVHDVTGRPVTIHRTYIAVDGSGKAPVEKPRKVVCSHGKSPHVRLTPIEPVMGLAEGIETALAAAKLFGIPTWSALSTYGIETFEPQAEVDRLIIFGDHDTNGAGQKAAYALQVRLANRLAVEVRIPAHPGDWNDVLRSQ